ncbi:LEAF RUST 10 DISEASE-RESISTANCE LOCUS RECEPTOR-LIKE PROTEIN KINASE-like 2.4 [Pistacia vera]|uniref:LEAF RUST 10 DISEASE-RESISTANCE LOCUS RECEPTOR-LIKE PROTEIN KINASE-like 2.4 n=1 Tax=Pistacia vera TaxID=55513 RepID=UPI00126373CC|nr:LEAF RUST 10 DISEASE-RESISTANCE LOCUS RECEPTOR-LIKE PROTEIN KINASE-like 2.4 [Pistacia vera]
MRVNGIMVLTRCGNFAAGYPFWGGDRPSGCGHPDLQLYCGCDGIRERIDYYYSSGDVIHNYCSTDRPTMVINAVVYSILNIDEKAQILKISRVDYLDRICSPVYPNSTIKSTLLNYDPGYELLTLSYNCQGYASSPAVHFSCSENNSYSYDNVSIAEGLAPTLEGCETFNTVPVSRSLHSTMIGNLSVLEEAIREGFQVKWTVSGIACEECKSNGSCGYDLQFNKAFCYCPNGLSFTSCSTPKEPSPSSGVAACAVGILIILSIFLMSGRLRRKLRLDKVVFFWKDKTENDENIEAIVRNYGSLAPKRYNFSDIKNMTKSFSNKLGQGGYGDVYKGILPDGPLVAVKVLKESKGNGEEFMNEVANISRTSHVNIVALLGFCCERNKKALIYEFMPNGSLDKFIYDQESSSMNQKLEWKTKFQIAVGIARGLEYLHRGCSIRIVHFDIRPQNILLNEDFCPKISDFGLAKQSKNKESTISMLDARGTIVYSYGMMILEMVGGRKNNDVTASRTDEIYSPHWLFKHLEPGKEEDLKLHGVVTEEEEEMAKKMIFVSSWCIQTFPSDRPSMTKVVEMLEGSLENLQIPPKPSTSSPTMSPPKNLPLQHHRHKLESQEESSGKPGDM